MLLHTTSKIEIWKNATHVAFICLPNIKLFAHIYGCKHAMMYVGDLIRKHKYRRFYNEIKISTVRISKKMKKYEGFVVIK